jgi:hypothetical protein
MEAEVSMAHCPGEGLWRRLGCMPKEGSSVPWVSPHGM